MTYQCRVCSGWHKFEYDTSFVLCYNYNYTCPVFKLHWVRVWFDSVDSYQRLSSWSLRWPLRWQFINVDSISWSPMCWLDGQLSSLSITFVRWGGWRCRRCFLCHKMGPGFVNDSDWLWCSWRRSGFLFYLHQDRKTPLITRKCSCK